MAKKWDEKICPYLHGTTVLGMSMATTCMTTDCALWDEGDHACSVYLAARATLEMRQKLNNIDSTLYRLPCNKR